MRRAIHGTGILVINMRFSLFLYLERFVLCSSALKLCILEVLHERESHWMDER